MSSDLFAAELSLSCAWPAADGGPLTCMRVNRRCFC